MTLPHAQRSAELRHSSRNLVEGFGSGGLHRLHHQTLAGDVIGIETTFVDRMSWLSLRSHLLLQQAKLLVDSL